MKKPRRRIYAFFFLAANMLCIALMLLFVSPRWVHLKKELEADCEILRLKEERFQMYDARQGSFEELMLIANRLEKNIQPAGAVVENIAVLCSVFEGSGLELTDCIAGKAEKIGTDGEYGTEDGGVLRQTVSLEGYGTPGCVYDFIGKIENSEALYRIESLNLKAGSDFSEEDISLDINIAMFVQTESFSDE